LQYPLSQQNQLKPQQHRPQQRQHQQQVRQQLRKKRRSLQKVLLSRTKRQQHQLLSQQQSNLGLDDSDDDSADEIDVHVAYRRPEVIKESYVYDLDSDDDDLPLHITERLAQIRALALEKYKEVHA
jgi:hypothetical protein